MTRKWKAQSATAAGSMVKGVILALLLTLTGAMILGKLVDKEIIRMEAVGYGAMVVIGISAWLAAGCSMNGVSEKWYLSGAAGSGAYFAALLGVNALFFGGQYPGFWSGFVVTLIGTGAAVLMTGKGRDSHARKRYKIPRG